MNDMGDLPQVVADPTFTPVRGGRATVPPGCWEEDRSPVVGEQVLVADSGAGPFVQRSRASRPTAPLCLSSTPSCQCTPDRQRRSATSRKPTTDGPLLCIRLPCGWGQLRENWAYRAEPAFRERQTLATLQRLSNADKHRTLHVINQMMYVAHTVLTVPPQ
jgi:hypothetical protein